MDVRELYAAGGEKIDLWACGKCTRFYGSVKQAENCCSIARCRLCRQLVERKYYAVCNACESAERERKEIERFEKAEKLEAWDGWVFCDGVGHGDGFSEGISELYDWLSESDDMTKEDWPTHAYACKSTPLVRVSFGRIMEQIEESDDAYEDFDSGVLKGCDELKAAIDAFNEANKDVVSYQPDYSRVVMIPPPPDDMPDTLED